MNSHRRVYAVPLYDVLRCVPESIPAVIETDRQDGSPTASILAEVLAKAAWAEDETVVKAFLDAGFDPSTRPRYDITPLHMAVEQQNVGLLTMLIDAGADVNQQTDMGSTPLHRAVDVEADTAHQRCVAPTPIITTLLLQAGADPNIANRMGELPIGIALAYRYDAAVALLREAMAKPPPTRLIVPRVQGSAFEPSR